MCSLHRSILWVNWVFVRLYDDVWCVTCVSVSVYPLRTHFLLLLLINQMRWKCSFDWCWKLVAWWQILWHYSAEHTLTYNAMTLHKTFQQRLMLPCLCVHSFFFSSFYCKKIVLRLFLPSTRYTTHIYIQLNLYSVCNWIYEKIQQINRRKENMKKMSKEENRFNISILCINIINSGFL